jgi:hypothetical protein
VYFNVFQMYLFMVYFDASLVYLNVFNAFESI